MPKISLVGMLQTGCSYSLKSVARVAACQLGTAEGFALLSLCSIGATNQHGFDDNQCVWSPSDESITLIQRQLRRELRSIVRDQVQELVVPAMKGQVKAGLPAVVAQKLDSDLMDLAGKIADKGNVQLESIINADAKLQLTEQVLHLLKQNQTLLKQVR